MVSRILIFLFCLQSLSGYSQITKGGGGDPYHDPPNPDLIKPRYFGDPELTAYLKLKVELIKALNDQLAVCSQSYVATKSLIEIYQHIQIRIVLGDLFRSNENFINDCSQDSFSACVYTPKVKSKVKAFMEQKKHHKYFEIDLQDKKLANQISKHFEEILKDE